MQAWHDEQRVERGRYAGLLAAGVTDAATLEPPAPVPARRVEVARATQVALPVWLAAPGAAARPVVGALPVLPTAMRAADVRAAGVLVLRYRELSLFSSVQYGGARAKVA